MFQGKESRRPRQGFEANARAQDPYIAKTIAVRPRGAIDTRSNRAVLGTVRRVHIRLLFASEGVSPAEFCNEARFPQDAASFARPVDHFIGGRFDCRGTISNTSCPPWRKASPANGWRREIICPVIPGKEQSPCEYFFRQVTHDVRHLGAHSNRRGAMALRNVLPARARPALLEPI